MTLTLILIRHGKAEPGGAATPDHDRALADRGHRDAARIGAWLDAQDLRPDAALVSTARRTVQTWEGIAGAMATPPGATFDARLYDADPGTVLAVLAESAAECLAVVGHNPTTADLAHRLGRRPPDHPDFARHPTGSTTVLRFDADGWGDVAAGTGTAVAFAVPRDLSDPGSG